MYLRVENGNVLTYPYSLRQFRLENKNVSLPDPPSDAQLAELGIFKVQATNPPVLTVADKLLETNPVEVDGVWVQSWIVSPKFAEYTTESGVLVTVQEQIDAELAKLAADAAKVAREQAKAARLSQVESIKVTTSSGKTFDGDETSQTRMARAIIALQATGTPTVTWVLADNTPTEATVPELVEALALAGAAQAAVWVLQ